jgi:hypothetical protein
MEYGQLITETITSSKPITEELAITGYDRSCMFSQYVDVEDVDEDLALLFAYANYDHASYRLTDGIESCQEWRMVYRHYPPLD